MIINLKYRIFRIANYGILSASSFKEKKTLQIYNIYLLFLVVNVFILGVLLIIFGFYYQLYLIAITFIALLFSLYLNKKEYTLISKIFIIQYFILTIFIVLYVFSFKSIFTLYFFHVVLYCTLIFYDKERKIKIFFIIQSFLFLLFSLSPYHQKISTINFLKKSELSDINLICIIGFICLLFTFIYFQTDYQRKLELKYLLTNIRLQKRNQINKRDNYNNKKLLSIISTSLQLNLERYKILFKSYLDHLNEVPNDTKLIDSHFIKMSDKNKKIEELINFRFTNNREVFGQENFTKCLIKMQSLQILIDAGLNNITIDTTNDFEINMHLELYKLFLIEIIKDKKCMFRYEDIQLNFKLEHQSKFIVIDDNSFELMGFKVLCFFNSQIKKLNLDIYFLTPTDNRAIYYV
jgi:hypothetical protein